MLYIALFIIASGICIFLLFLCTVLLAVNLILRRTIHQDDEKIQELETKVPELKKYAYIDALTGLPNYFYLMDYYQRLMSQIKRQNIRQKKDFDRRKSGSKLAVLFIDLDGFKAVNDTYGHRIGDFILQEVADRLRSIIRRQYELVARKGGDEFVVILPDYKEPNEVIMMAKTIINSIKSPYLLKEDGILVEIKIGVSIGIAFYNADTPGQDLINCADKAMYEAKNYKNTWRISGL